MGEDSVKRKRGDESNPGKKTPQMGADEFANLAKERLSSALGKKAYGVSSMSASGDGWSVEIEIIEEEHLVSNYDVVGIYEARFDREGNLMSWSRKGLRQRG